ncbi:MAG: glucuronate isomerase, partial [Gemmatimonadales bacterium]|nr:glucuronate isomerase [Gemmatimonadales bacterium]NIR00616.1 glucuronate isomerase [Gemmatimonadales bacterium]
DKVFALAGVERVVMTNDPFDDAERRVWLDGCEPDERFAAALRLDQVLNAWDQAWPRLREWGYTVDEQLSASTLREVRRFLADWAGRMEALYLAVSLPPTFAFPEDAARGLLIEECVLPVCRELNRPFAMMIGVKKLVSPELRLAGDAVGKADIEAVEHLCSRYPRNKFMVTMLSRENQHELCVAARKFRNLLVFGCWWFLNNPSLVEEITRMRFELLGTSVVPQHSDARVLDQLIYKWSHSRRIIADVLYEKYRDLAQTGWAPEEAEIRRDVEKLFAGNFRSFLERAL